MIFVVLLGGWNPVAKNHNRKGELITGPSPLRTKKESKSDGESKASRDGNIRDGEYKGRYVVYLVVL